jgi:hypothetical protein
MGAGDRSGSLRRKGREMKWLKFKTRYSAVWKDAAGKDHYTNVTGARVGLAIQVSDEFAKIALAEGVAVQCDPGDGPIVPPAVEPVKDDKMERAHKADGRRTK